MIQIEYLSRLAVDTQISFKKFHKTTVSRHKWKQWKSADVSKSSQMIHHSKVIGKSFPEM